MNFESCSLYSKYVITYKRYSLEFLSFDNRKYILLDTMKNPQNLYMVVPPLTQYDIDTSTMKIVCQSSIRLGLNVSTQLPSFHHLH